MTEKNQGAAEWLRRIIDQYEAKVGPLCGDMAELFGLCCDDFYTCPECRVKMMRAIADRIDAERALPEGIEWPRFEDGELVKIGDEVEFKGEAAKVLDVAFSAARFSLGVGTATTSGRVYGYLGEPVKQLTPKVLDADGVPIEVGDTVYLRSSGREGEVAGFCKEDGKTWVFVSYKLGSDSITVNTEGKALTHERPDSWERLEEDAYHLVMSEYLDTPDEDVRDIVRRAKALAKAGE